MSKTSIPYWLKKNNSWGGPYEKIVEAVLYHAAHGDHPDIAFEGSTLELATALYVEHARKAGDAVDELYCTRPDVAEKMARSLNLQEGDVVFIPGLGLGALALAVRKVQPKAAAIGIECQDWLVRVAKTAGLAVEAGDFLNGNPLPSIEAVLDAVMVNPVWGKLRGSNQVEREFMARIATVTRPGHKIAALLPGQPGYFFDKLPGCWAYLKLAFDIKEAEGYPDGATEPKSLSCTRYLLERV